VVSIGTVKPGLALACLGEILSVMLRSVM